MFAAAAVIAGSLAACGATSSTNASTPSATVKTYLSAAANGDGATACSVVAPAAQNEALKLARSQGIKASSCANLFSQLKAAMNAAQRSTLRNAKVSSVIVRGNTATVRLKGGTTPATLEKSDGKWLITGGFTAG